MGSLWTGRKDGTLDWSTVEVGILLNVLLTIRGSIWVAQPGDWWTWDPRLTCDHGFSFMGVFLLRRLTTNPERRTVLTAAGAVVAFVNVPIVYMSVNGGVPCTSFSYDTVSNTWFCRGLLLLACCFW